jgi:uncharacterized membrane protein
MSALPGWHPLVVHFPLALIVTATLLLCAARLLRQEGRATTLAVVGTWNLCLGTAAALLAVATGLAAVVDLQVGQPAHLAISAHLRWAIFSTLVLVLLSVWRGAGVAPESRPSWLFMALLLAGTAALIVTGFRGAENVYRYGIGVGAGAMDSSSCLSSSSGRISPAGIGGGLGTAVPAFCAGICGSLPASGGCIAVRSVASRPEVDQPPPKSSISATLAVSSRS